MLDFTAHQHPYLAVRCPECGRAPGLWCRQPNGSLANDFHLSRKAQADVTFIDQHGPDASIERVGDGWAVDPRGRVGIRPRPEPSAPT
ncbi:zinc finger domain-containing protein [Phaeobacter inhibens]|uniref:zinc finger domain-containing protein n=1 Tax=Phaeobacter inhibens TaxID=221822 RepID=UPI004055D8CE